MFKNTKGFELVAALSKQDPHLDCECDAERATRRGDTLGRPLAFLCTGLHVATDRTGRRTGRAAVPSNTTLPAPICSLHRPDRNGIAARTRQMGDMASKQSAQALDTTCTDAGLRCLSYGRKFSLTSENTASVFLSMSFWTTV